ncbi:ethanolamine ammonia-lyase subunit EutC [Spirosoma taeanense]|uniref:Ethanolamine ammonia-lyase small subunit n=1 Tax=Spirosoma taeanense TaxID=2735870 RepID=A0A6M5Y453_9BACT|nr:ethanolamine ammonia-lyase subunit EutC [Spirosoma taeanense]QJW89327.1 ethanolamine ammonia-lyase subunit EutC [Spirosoma taeanense]
MTNYDPWVFLQTHTSARIAQGRVGHSLPTRAWLDFQLDHAQARDAVYSQLDTAGLLGQLHAIHPNPILLRSLATDRRMYLQRPDLGRRLDAVSERNLNAMGTEPPTLSLVIADGLSATAINRHGIPVVTNLVNEARKQGWLLAPFCLVEQGRVAIGDAIAHALGAEMVVVLIGERPGLSSPDSMGAYLTYAPRPGLTDESRNCISNIRPEGLPYEFAVQKLMYLLTEMKTRRLSGVELKDEMPIHTRLNTSSPAENAQTPEIPD